MQVKKGVVTDVMLSKMLAGRASDDEVENFADWIKNIDNERYFEQFKEVWHASQDIQPGDELIDQSLKSLLNYIRNRKRKELFRKRVIYIASTAAAILLVFGLFSMFEFIRISGKYDNVLFSDLKYNSESIKVELADGRVINPLTESIGVEDGYQESLTTQNPREINYQRESRLLTDKKDSLKYNSVSIPAGERFVIILSDGTKVYMHSNSCLRYPVSFNSSSRNVSLAGRAYFDVKKSDVPFIVTTNDLSVEVLGTTFDVESKKGADNSSVILIEGSVKVHTSKESKIISPNEMFSFSRRQGESSVSSVDSKAMTQWKDGILVLRELSFNELIESLSSWYGVEIINQSSISNDERFNGKFDRENIEAAIKTVAISAKVRYRIDKGRLIIVDYK
ncbi:MAG: hypothetical protein A2X17_08805 [Bacteroidetes bacterium GWF2_41_61]|nr:MAG: hypothetical protein A2X20_08275 [Bacteroidetes bacterium GWE2_40_15]OFY26233.1 MAG: hypothetical protein A2X17_08805 [Bacteroidetes bacterium GWF2_41_61]OFY90971.1 MAG: hypothetical protein A2266_08825 [Bacteroidetes bacterium RIFOXYA12_FULL_40_10]HBG24454.1 hypothetical protein [Rikenellaceae bacterium]HBZ25928.1 hypothetical protein [Rikenellaceae bacterium]